MEIVSVPGEGERAADSELAGRRNLGIEQIAEWCGRFPSCNWACATGTGSGVWVLDVDGEEGLNTFYLLCKQHGFFDTLGVKTSSRSSHLYFSWPTNGDVVRNSVKKLPGLDVRGERGYVIVPPSIHRDGSTYEWLGERESQPMIEAPLWLLSAVNENREGA